LTRRHCKIKRLKKARLRKKYTNDNSNKTIYFPEKVVFNSQSIYYNPTELPIQDIFMPLQPLDTDLLSHDFRRINRLPPYVFNIVNELKAKARGKGEDIIDFGMGNPDQPTPQHIVDKLVDVATKDHTHRYSLSKGIPRLRQAICNWYQKKFDVTLDPETEAIVSIGSKEGLAHLALATTGPGDTVLVPNPSYPIHTFGFVISGADIRHVQLTPDVDFFAALKTAIIDSWPKPKMLVLNFPANPTAQCVELDFFEQVIAIAREYGIWVIHDLAYGEIVFDGYKPPSILQVPGAKDIAVEFYSLSKTYNMAGWRVGFMCGNPELVQALARIKSYLDYGTFTPIQVAAVAALEDDQSCVEEICSMYQRRRDVLYDGLTAIGWELNKPKGSMYIWAKIPEAYAEMKSLEFAKKLLHDAKVAVSPGIGFGIHGDDHVRFALIENEHRTRQAIRGVRAMFRKDGLIS
jgi:alanine-synthesizing transaminase